MSEDVPDRWETTTDAPPAEGEPRVWGASDGALLALEGAEELRAAIRRAIEVHGDYRAEQLVQAALRRERGIPERGFPGRMYDDWPGAG